MADDVLSADDLMGMFESSLMDNSSVESRQLFAPTPMNNFQTKPEVKEENNFIREGTGTDYATKYRLKEEQMVVTRALNLPSMSAQDTVVKIEDDDDEDDGMGIVKKLEGQELPKLNAYDRYQFNLNPHDLPILNKREYVLRKIHESNVIVLTAATGTGKSSQIPQYIIEEAYKRREKCNIIVTQPRRIAGKLLTLK
jgi:ATP-dependent RNA helicase TDRD9